MLLMLLMLFQVLRKPVGLKKKIVCNAPDRNIFYKCMQTHVYTKPFSPSIAFLCIPCYGQINAAYFLHPVKTKTYSTRTNMVLSLLDYRSNHTVDLGVTKDGSASSRYDVDSHGGPVAF